MEDAQLRAFWTNYVLRRRCRHLVHGTSINYYRAIYRVSNVVSNVVIIVLGLMTLGYIFRGLFYMTT